MFGGGEMISVNIHFQIVFRWYQATLLEREMKKFEDGLCIRYEWIKVKQISFSVLL